MKVNEFNKIFSQAKLACEQCDSVNGIIEIREQFEEMIPTTIEPTAGSLTDKQAEKLDVLFMEYVGKYDEGAHAIEKKNKKMTKQESKNEVVKVEVNPVDNGIDAATEKKVNSTVAKIEKKIGTIEKGYLSIIGDVAYLAEHDGHKVTGHKNIYELCKDKFGMARGTVHNLLAIYEHFGENYALKDDYKEMSLRKMLEQIKNEKEAQKLIEAGDPVVDEEGEEGEGESTSKKSTKKTSLVDFNFANAEKWTLDELFDHIREELESAGINEVDAMTTITFKLDV